MAEHVHKTYTCDRCKASLGSERPKPSQGANVRASFNWSEGPGPSFQWDDLCSDCRKAVFAFFLPGERP